MSDSRKFPKPIVFCSKCLGFAECRWNGVTIDTEVTANLKPFVNFIIACPEVECGMTVPRKPVRIVKINEQERLIQRDTNEDFTDRMTTFTNDFLDRLPEVEGFILKTRSPSCGPYDVKVYTSLDAKGGAGGRTMGIFGAEIMHRWGPLAIEDEGRLTNFTLRERFLIKIFALADFRKVRNKPTAKKLMDFHANNKLLLMACNQTRMRELGKLVANHEKLPIEQVTEKYEKGLMETLRHGTRPSNSVNVLMHALGYFKKELLPNEKVFFLDLLESYRKGKVPLSAPVSVIRSWIHRTDNQYLASQTFFEPYPEGLIEISDSGKGRSY